MGIHSGKYGTINGVSTVHRWTVSETTTPIRTVASNTKAGSSRKEGVYDYTGVMEGYGGVPPVMPSEYFNFLGFTAPTTGARATAGKDLSANNAIVESVTVNWDWSSGEILGWTANFAAGQPLILTRATSSTVDNTTFLPKVICGTKVTLTAGNTVWPNIVSAALTITAANPRFVNSSTGGATGRRPGVIDWSAAIVEQATGPNATLTTAACLTTEVGGDNILRLWCDATTYWDLTYAHLASISDLVVDLKTDEIIQQTNNFEMAGFDVSGNEGYIGRPGEDGGSNPWWWPDDIIAATLPF